MWCDIASWQVTDVTTSTPSCLKCGLVTSILDELGWWKGVCLWLLGSWLCWTACIVFIDNRGLFQLHTVTGMSMLPMEPRCCPQHCSTSSLIGALYLYLTGGACNLVSCLVLCLHSMTLFIHGPAEILATSLSDVFVSHYEIFSCTRNGSYLYNGLILRLCLRFCRCTLKPASSGRAYYHATHLLLPLLLSQPLYLLLLAMICTPSFCSTLGRFEVLSCPFPFTFFL